MSIFSSENPFAGTALEMHCLFSLQLEKQIHSMHFPLCLSPLKSCFFCLCFWVHRIFLKINKNDRNNFFNELAMIASIEWPVETAHFSKCNCVCSAFVFFSLILSAALLSLSIFSGVRCCCCDVCNYTVAQCANIMRFGSLRIHLHKAIDWAFGKQAALKNLWAKTNEMFVCFIFPIKRSHRKIPVDARSVFFVRAQRVLGVHAMGNMHITCSHARP